MTRGTPRIQYERTYILLPPGADASWAKATAESTWDAHRYTIGGSADDAGVANLDYRHILIVRPNDWESNIVAFFEEYYPGVLCTPVYAQTPEDLKSALRALEPEPEPDPDPQPIERVLVGFNDPNCQGAGQWMMANGVHGVLCVPLFIGDSPQRLDFRGYEAAGIKVVVNLRYGWSVDKGGQGTLPPSSRWLDFAHACIQTMQPLVPDSSQPGSAGVWGFTIGNEANNPREFPENTVLTPSYAASIYTEIWHQTRPYHVRLAPGAVDPFYGPGSDCGAWLAQMYQTIPGVDFIDVHGYLRGPDPNLCWSDAHFDNDPLLWQGLNYWECCQQILNRLPDAYNDHQVVVSEFNHLWVDVEPDWGWVSDQRAATVVTAAMNRAQQHNDQGQGNPIMGVCVYRWLGDEWDTAGNAQVHDAVRQWGVT